MKVSRGELTTAQEWSKIHVRYLPPSKKCKTYLSRRNEQKITWVWTRSRVSHDELYIAQEWVNIHVGRIMQEWTKIHVSLSMYMNKCQSTWDIHCAQEWAIFHVRHHWRFSRARMNKLKNSCVSLNAPKWAKFHMRKIYRKVIHEEFPTAQERAKIHLSQST